MQTQPVRMPARQATGVGWYAMRIAILLLALRISRVTPVTPHISACVHDGHEVTSGEITARDNEHGYLLFKVTEPDGSVSVRWIAPSEEIVACPGMVAAMRPATVWVGRMWCL